MAFKSSLLTLSLTLIAACGAATPDRSSTQDIASDFGTIFAHFLYYRDGDNIVQGGCNSNTVLYDRAVCQQAPQRVAAARLYRELQTEFGAHVEELTAQAAEWYTRVQQIDAKIIELLNASGGAPSRPDLAAQIQSLEGEFNTHTVAIVGLREQISLIQQALATQNDADQRLQLALLESQIAARLTARTNVQTQLATLRQEYVLANTDLLDGQLFHQLQHQRDQALGVWESYQSQVVAEGNESIDLQRVVAMLEDDYVFVEDMGSSSQYMGIIMSFHDLIKELNEQPVRFTTVGRRTDLELSIDVTSWSSVKTMQCRFESQLENRCTAVQVTGPNNVTGTMSNQYIQTRGNGTNTMINQSGEGHWTFKIVSTCGNQPIVLSREPWCELGVD